MNLEKASCYINHLYEKKGINQKEYVESSNLKNFGQIIDEDVSRMIQVLCRLTRPMKILEIGTSIGYSTISMADIIKDYGGKITTIECDRRVAEQAIENFERAGVTENIEVKIGDAQEIVPKIDDKFDIIFQDVGNKKLYPLLFDDCVRILKLGGLLLAEDTLFPVVDEFKVVEHIKEHIKTKHVDAQEIPGGLLSEEDVSFLVMDKYKQWQEEVVVPINKFNEMIANSPNLESTILSIGDGFTMAIKMIN